MFWVCLCLGAGATLALALPEAKDELPAKPGTILKADGPITIDGVLDEPAWQQAKTVEAKWIWGKVSEASKEPRMNVKYTWDDNYLYIGYETFDKNLVALGSGEKKGPKGNEREGARISDDKAKVDVVEFFISFGDPNHFWEVHQNAANHFNDIWITVVDEKQPGFKSTMFFDGIYFGWREFIKDDPDAGVTLKTAVKLKPKADGKPSTLNDSSDEDTGYIGEMRLPWAGLGAPKSSETWVGEGKGRHRGPWKMAGQEIMLLAVFQDGDTKEHYFHSSPTKPGSWFHKGTNHWPRYVLEARKP
jgi:hypothetical protein